MKKTVLIGAVIALFFLSGCSFGDGKIYSVKKFLNNRDEFINRPAKLRGVILLKNECADNLCAPSFIFNDAMDAAPNNNITINVLKPNEDFNKTDINEPVLISVQYYPKGTIENVIENDNGYYVLNYFLK